MSITGAVIVSYYYKKNKDDTDTAVAVVGQKNLKQDVAIINAFEDDEAKELWEKLTIHRRKPEL